jgi:hypothetical protein
MGLDRPPIVKRDPRHNHLIARWTVHLLSDGMPADVKGDLEWLAIKPTSMYWLALVLVIPVGGVTSVLLIRRRRLRGNGLTPDGSAAVVTTQV